LILTEVDLTEKQAWRIPLLWTANPHLDVTVIC